MNYRNNNGAKHSVCCVWPSLYRIRECMQIKLRWGNSLGSWPTYLWYHVSFFVKAQDILCTFGGSTKRQEERNTEFVDYFCFMTRSVLGWMRTLMVPATRKGDINASSWTSYYTWFLARFSGTLSSMLGVVRTTKSIIISIGGLPVVVNQPATWYNTSILGFSRAEGRSARGLLFSSRTEYLIELPYVAGGGDIKTHFWFNTTTTTVHCM